jgi:serine/threonine protein kinase
MFMSEEENKLKKDIIRKLQEISQAQDRDALIAEFKKEYPNHLDWLHMFDNDNAKASAFAGSGTGLKGQAANIAGFEFIKSLGCGASGQVFLAQQHQPQREVAIKIAMQHLSDEQIHRFQHESRLLSKLSHPHIAQLYQSGILAEQQLPYIIMEYVDGINIKRYCYEHKLGFKQIIHLFNQVLDAVQYAHNLGIVHRDIKPENILVNQKGEVKLLDFGIALATENSTQQLTQLTKTGEIVGTLAYMSPEQVSGQDSLDTRADVYSLGVVLYQLLSQALPHKLDANQIFSAISQIIEDLPAKITTHNQQIDANLATIVHHAIEKNPNQRYQSPRDFKADLINWLDGVDISVKHNTLWHTLRHISKKHKALVAGSFLAIIGLLSGLVFAVSFALKEQKAKEVAEANALTSKKTVEFITELFASADPENIFGEKLTLLQVINNADLALISQLKAEHEVQANIRITIAGVYISLGQAELAQKQLDQVQKLYPYLSSNNRFADIKYELARVQSGIYKYNNKYALDIDYLNKLLAEENYATPKRLILQVELANSLISDGKLTEAKSIINQVLIEYKEILPDDNTYVLYALVTKAMALDKMGEFKQSKILYENVIAHRIKIFGAKHPKTLTAMNNLTAVERSLGHLDKARQIFEQIIATKTEVLGADHLSTLISKSNLLTIMVELGELDKADIYSKVILAEFIQSLGSLHSRTLEVYNMRAYLLEDLGKLAAAEKIYQDNLNRYKEAGTTTGPGLFGMQNNLAMLLMKQSKYLESKKIFNALLENVDGILGKEHIYYAIFIGNYGELLMKMQDYPAARVLLQQSLDKISATFGESHQRTLKAKKRLEHLKQLEG